MGLQSRTIQKLFREDFPGATPLVIAATEREKLGADLKAKLRDFTMWIRKTTAMSARKRPRLVCSFSINYPGRYHYYGSHTTFRLILDDLGRLTIKEDDSGNPALVSDLDEVVRFVQHCKERLERQKALRVKRGKVRDLLAQGILAQIRKLAKEEHFDFMSETDEQKLNLFVKLSDEHAVVLHIPFKEFKQFLPQLRSVIVTLRQLYENGIRFKIVGRAGLPWRQSWITHENL